MSPWAKIRPWKRVSFPRVSGDEPIEGIPDEVQGGFSPRERG